jgi:hypothetical protein
VWLHLMRRGHEASTFLTAFSPTRFCRIAYTRARHLRCILWENGLPFVRDHYLYQCASKVMHLYRPPPTAQVLPQLKLIHLMVRPVPLPFALRLHLMRLLLQAAPPPHARRHVVRLPQSLLRLAMHMPRLAATSRPAAVARRVAHRLPALLLVRLLAVAPAVAAREDVLDALVGFELAGLRGPVGCERAAVHVLELACFAGLAGEGGCGCDVSIDLQMTSVNVHPLSSSSACSPAMMPAMPLNTCAVLSAGAMKFLSPSVCRMNMPSLSVLLILLFCMRYRRVTPESSPSAGAKSLCSTYSARFSLT